MIYRVRCLSVTAAMTMLVACGNRSGAVHTAGPSHDFRNTL